MSGVLFDRLRLSPDERAFLQRYHFDTRAFERLQRELEEGEFPPERNRTTHTVEPLQSGDLVDWPESETDQANHWRQLGNQTIEEGRVAVVILNGGMATRFGGAVKGVVEVLDGASFLALKLGDVNRTRSSGPIFLMNSFATAEETAEHLEAHRSFGIEPDRLHLLNQRVSIRLNRRGRVYRDDQGRVGYYAPGHGDVFEVLAETEPFQRFQERGGVVLISNVDNLGATLSSKVIGAHLDMGRAVTVEVAPRAASDRGGAPVRVGGRLEVLEGFRFPKDFELNTIPVFNTNTLLINSEAVRPDFDLTWFRADKEVDGQQVVQFERLMGEVTSFVDTTFLCVPRDGPEGRFLPVKTPEDLVAVRPAVRTRFGRQRI
jgi:UTP--glucose-1-phosphate uridylyltransferase